MKIKLKTMIIALTLIPSTVITIVLMLAIPKVASEALIELTKTELMNSAEIIKNYVLDLSSTFEVVDNHLYNDGADVNETNIFNNMLNRDVEVTIFNGTIRVATTFHDEKGNPIVGTECPEEVANYVLGEGEDYFTTSVQINNKDYYGYYLPLKNEGKTTGMIFAGKEREAIDAAILKIGTASLSISFMLTIISVVVSIVINTRLSSQLKQMISCIHDISAKDLSKPFVISTQVTELSDIVMQLEGMRKELNNNMLLVNEKSKEIDNISNQQAEVVSNCNMTVISIATASEDLAQASTEMAQSISTTKEVFKELNNSALGINTMSDTNVSNAASVQKECMTLNGKVSVLTVNMQDTNSNAERVYKSVMETAKIVQDILKSTNDIISLANKTNLLSLNASVEAARAGEHGKGFAVVAQEIKVLSEQSNVTAKEITKLVQDIETISQESKEMTVEMLQTVKDTSGSLVEMQNTFNVVNDTLLSVINGNNDIDVLLKTFIDKLHTIETTVDSISSIAETNAAMSEDTSTSISIVKEEFSHIDEDVHTLHNTSSELADTVNQFKM